VIDALASHIAEELSLQAASVLRTLALLDDGNTIPFIARYRKEVTGGLDEVQIAAIAKRAESLRALEARRAEVRRLIEEQGALTGALAAAPPHRILAINRGEREGALRVSVETPEDQALGVLARHYPADDRSSLAGDLRRAAADGLERLLAPSLEPEMRADLTGRAEAHAIGVFAANQRPLLLQPPLRGRTVIGIDPGYRTGCKVAVVDETAWVLATGTIFPHPRPRRAATWRRPRCATWCAHTGPRCSPSATACSPWRTCG
jgi:transcriptional accessory protein Tex/SPT6